MRWQDRSSSEQPSRWVTPYDYYQEISSTAAGLFGHTSCVASSPSPASDSSRVSGQHRFVNPPVAYDFCDQFHIYLLILLITVFRLSIVS